MSIDMWTSLLNNKGLTLEIRHDFDFFKKLAIDIRVRSGEKAFINPTYDHYYSKLTKDNSFWLDIKHEGTTVAIIANKYFPNVNLTDLIVNSKLWSDTNIIILLPLDVYLTPELHGNICSHGNLFVVPSWRKRGLSTILTHLTRALSLEKYNPDYHIGVTSKTLVLKGLVQNNYGYTNCIPLFDGYFPLTSSDECLYLTYINKVEMLAQQDPAYIVLKSASL